MSRTVEFLIVVIVISLVFLLLSLFLKQYPQTFYRDKPNGLCEAVLENKPNWVSSLVERSNSHYVASLPIVSFDKFVSVIEQIDPKTYVVVHPYYIEGYRRTNYLGFTDWFCINNLGHVTSSATLGYSDLGNNRRWVEALRERLEKG